MFGGSQGKSIPHTKFFAAIKTSFGGENDTAFEQMRLNWPLRLSVILGAEHSSISWPNQSKNLFCKFGLVVIRFSVALGCGSAAESSVNGFLNVREVEGAGKFWFLLDWIGRNQNNLT